MTVPYTQQDIEMFERIDKYRPTHQAIKDLAMGQFQIRANELLSTIRELRGEENGIIKSITR